MPRIVIAAPASGSGKTTIAVGLMRALVRRGVRVAPFKIGPDYIDPTHHRLAAGRASRSLDSWLLPPHALLGVFARGASGTDIAIVEGVMGVLDGRTGDGPTGSTAETAALLGAPIVLVIDAHAMAQTAGAVVLGCAGVAPVAGVILNRVAGAAHAEMCQVAIERIAQVPVLGWLPRDPVIAIPERHLGLVLGDERSVDVDRLADLIDAHVDVDAVRRVAERAPALDVPNPAPALDVPRVGRPVVIGVARDAAFCFYYDDALDVLTERGAEIRFFSPLADAAPPADAGLLYFGGGYPELHAAALAANTDMRQAVRTFAESGRPIYAECGGLMYLGEALDDLDGRRHAMTGVIPVACAMTPRVTIGYRELVALADSPLAAAGHRLRGHEFHYSTMQPNAASHAAYRRDDGRDEGVLAGPRHNVLASYIHVHLGGDLRLADRLIASAGTTTP